MEEFATGHPTRLVGKIAHLIYDYRPKGSLFNSCLDQKLCKLQGTALA
jgi:hypothetical protein